MQMIKVAEGCYVVPSAVGSLESTCERLEGSGTIVCRTTIRSITGGVLFNREDRAKLDDARSCEVVQITHREYANNLMNG